KARAAQRAYRKKPRVNTEELWREYTAQRDVRRALYETKHALIRAETGERIRAAKNDAANRRLAARLLFKGVARQANCFAINVALKRTIRAIHRHADEQYRQLAQDNPQKTWLDWLQAEAKKGAPMLSKLYAPLAAHPLSQRNLVPVSQAMHFQT